MMVYSLCLSHYHRHAEPTWGADAADWKAPCRAQDQSGTGQPESHQRWGRTASRPAALTGPGPDHPCATPPAPEPAGTRPGWHRSELWHLLCSHQSRSAEREAGSQVWLKQHRSWFYYILSVAVRKQQRNKATCRSLGLITCHLISSHTQRTQAY